MKKLAEAKGRRNVDLRDENAIDTRIAKVEAAVERVEAANQRVEAALAELLKAVLASK